MKTVSQTKTSLRSDARDTTRKVLRNMHKAMSKTVAWLVALAGAVSLASAQEFITCTSTNFAVSSNGLYLLTTSGGDENIIVCRSAGGGYIHLDSTATAAIVTNTVNGVPFVQTNSVLVNTYSNLLFGAIPILGTDQAGTSGKNIIVLKDGGDYGNWRGRIFFQSTNGPGTNFTLGYTKLKK